VISWQCLPLSGQVPDEAGQGRFVIPIISPNHYLHDLGLSGSCQSNKSEFLPNQYPHLASSQLHSQVWNDDSRAVSSIAAPDPPWWTDFVHAELFPSEVHQKRQIVPASVHKTSHTNEARSRISPEFQTAFQPSGFSQKLVNYNIPANFAIEFDSQAFQAYPDSADSITFQSSIPIVQAEWNSGESSSISEFDCDTYSATSNVLTSLGNDNILQESQENSKRQISVLHASRC